MNLTEHFTLDELCVSQIAARSGTELVPAPYAVENLKRLCETVLEPLRQRLGRAVIVSSGFRPKWLNTAVGGALNSAHLTGRAADIKVPGMAAGELALYIRRHDFPVDKCINEFGKWVHVQVSSAPDILPRRQYLTARHVEERTQYIDGLERQV